MAQSLSAWSRTLVMRLVDAVVGVRSGHVLVAHTSMITSMIATVITSMIASMVASKAWFSLSLAIVAMVIAMKTLWTPVVVAGGMMSISIPWLRVSLSLVIIPSIVTIVTIVTMGVEAVAV